ncbi:MAG: RNA 2',3'-cyclic phosphodiesterase [Candidatus Omnitrophota bacterium]|jgi:2'-5' RNA ligase
MPDIRAFIALEIDEQTKQKILHLLDTLKKSGADAKWLTENQLHLTLKFLGNIEDNMTQKISGVLSDISGSARPFAINFSETGAFPDLEHPRVICLGIGKGAEHLEALNREIENSLEELGFKKEERPFKPHLTLGRVRSLKNLPNLIKTIKGKEKDLEPIDNVKIDKLTLFKSRLDPEGAVYIPITRNALRKI